MTEDPNSQDEDELQIHQKFIELVKLVEKNSNRIKETKKNLTKEKSSLKKFENQMQDLDRDLGEKFDEIGQKFVEVNNNLSQYSQNTEKQSEEFTNRLATLEEKITQNSQTAERQSEEFTNRLAILEEKIIQNSQNAEKQSEEFTNQLAALEEKITQNSQNTEKLSNEITDKFNNSQRIQEEHEDRISKHQQTIEEHKNELQTLISKEQFNTDISEVIENANNQKALLQQSQSEIREEIKNLEEKTQAQSDTLAKTIEMLGSGLDQLDQLNKKIIARVEKYRLKLAEFKRKLTEIISLIKKDQQGHFENFSKIIESYNENIRTEISITTQSLKESDTQILDEVSASFMTKKIGKELQQTVIDLSEDLKSDAQKTRDELVQGLQKNVQEYEKSMKQQETSIKDYKVELQNFQEEILAIIDRKVNEKYEVVFSLLSKVALEAEEIALLIKTSEIHIPPPILSKTESSLDSDENQVDSPPLPTLSDDSENFEEE